MTQTSINVQTRFEQKCPKRSEDIHLALKTFKKSVNHLNKDQADTYIKTLLSMQGK